ncbi:MAG: putative selenate reductase subunit YgfK, partial [bacterium]|nr:putative selenate reductase subunit YgfK [bacterium]
MSDKFSVAPIDLLFKRILDEEKQTNCIYGIHKDLFFTASPSDTFKMKRYGKTLETPIGVAAGPHTQMTQNIITAWLTGARYMELKTVQTLDELEVAKPCIDMEDEGYNCEWSQELRLTESFDEYLKAWIIIHALRHKFGWNTANATDEPGFIFNMSVGYNLEGILKDNVQRFLAKMKNCAKEKKEAVETLAKVYPAIKNISIPDRLSDNITLSTMHGCPPEEIEKIALYLVEEKKYHTAIKLNPTLLGPQMLRGILNDKLGFDTDVPDEAFGHDLKYPDALNIIRNLEAAAKKHNVDFGLKLTNTLESVNNRDVFPGTEKMMYMSGRALHPLSINLAAKLRDEFPHMDISFSAGADCFNIADVIACDLKPVTVCSDILKPGGYQRLPQYLVTLADSMKKAQANSIEQLTGERDKKNARLKEYAAAVMEGDTYKKDHFPGNSIKTPRRLDAFDCIKAPCITTCPTNQDVPDYMYYTSVGEYDKAFAAILSKNPLPTVTGMVCDHLCMTKCTRNNYDAPLHIRAIKRFVCENATTEPLLKCAPKNGLKAAVIGAGPSGLSCAF